MKQLFKTPMVSLLLLVLGSGAYIGMKWKSPSTVFMVPTFLFFLLFFIVILRLRLRRRNPDATVVYPAKAGHVS